MMKRKTSSLITTLFLLGLSFQPLFAQEGTLKELVEAKRERKYAFYPSTLRMINLTSDKDYNELVSGVEKLLVYQLDSVTRADRSYRAIEGAYLENGFEEYAKAFGGQWNLVLLGKEGKENEFVGYFGEKDVVMAFYMRGKIAWEKIPTLINTLRGENLLNLLQL